MNCSACGCVDTTNSPSGWTWCGDCGAGNPPPQQPSVRGKLGGIVSALEELQSSGGLEMWAQDDLGHCVRQLELCREQLRRLGE